MPLSRPGGHYGAPGGNFVLRRQWGLPGIAAGERVLLGWYFIDFLVIIHVLIVDPRIFYGHFVGPALECRANTRFAPQNVGPALHFLLRKLSSRL